MTGESVSPAQAVEENFGYCRAIRSGNTIYVSGTTAVGGGRLIGKGDAYAQAKEILKIIKESIEHLGGAMEDVVRTRIFVTDMDENENIGKAHGEAFGENRPAATMVEVRRLIDPEMMVEIEAEAVISR